MSYDPEKITFFAKTDARGANVPFGIKAKDRTRHMYVIGKTGMGKSTLLENMAVQDIQNGEGMAFIDPHGQTAETLLDYIPEHRKDDVLYFAPFDTENPVAFNVMEDVGPDKRHLVVSGLMSVFKKIFVDAWSARMEYILSNTLLALLEYPDSTLLGVNRMLSDKVYRRKVIDNITDPAVKAFWIDEFLNYNERYMQEAGDSIKNKIGQFTANPLIRNIIGQPKSSFDLRKIMDDRKILIMNLSKGLVGESNANLLGSMLTTRIYLAAMSRADLGAAEMQQAPNFYFYVDEFQSFANATFADILSEARKYKLNLTIAHQYIEQMEEEVRNAVFGNVGTIAAFRVGPFDAEVLETIFAPQFYAVDICNLGFAQIYLTLMIDGIGSQPFSASTLPPIAPKSESCKQMVIHASRQQFAKNRRHVEDQINAWMAPTEPQQNRNGNNGNSGSNNGDQKRDHGPRGNSGNGNSNSANGGAPKRDAGQRDNNGRSADRSRSRQDARSDANHTASNKGNDTSSSGERNSAKKAENKNLDELRSILKNLTEAERVEKKGSKKSEKSDQDKPKTVEDKPVVKKDSGTSLKDALAEVLADREKKGKGGSVKTERQPEQRESSNERIERIEKSEIQSEKEKPKPVAQEENSKETPAEEKSKEVDVPVATPVSDNSYQAAKNRDPLDPKKLERMMRVTTSDRTPLK